MSIAAILVPPSLDAKQALRLRRFGLAAISYALAAAQVLLAWEFGAFPASAALALAAAAVAANLGLYLAIRSGFNLRFKDPSLTRIQILIAITFLMYIVYRMDAGRHVALFGCFLIILFGSYRLNPRQFTLVTLYTLAAYALVIDLQMYFRPQAIRDVRLDWMSWLMLAVWLPWFAIIAGQMNPLRRELRESESRFRSLTEMSSDFYWESDPEHRLTLLRAGSRASGVPMPQLAALVGKRRWETPYLAPDEAGWMAHRAVLDAHQPFRDFEFSRRGADGNVRHLLTNGDPVFDAAGAFKGYRGVGTDISARKQAEQALRDSVEKLRLFADNVPAMTAAFDDKLRFVFANKRFVEFFGYGEANIIGKHVREIVGADTYREIESHLVQVLQGHPVAYQRTHTLPSGESRYLEVRVLPHLGGQGQVLGCFAVTNDVTEYELAEQALRDSARELRLFTDNVPAITVAWDKDLRCRFANKAFAAIFGLAVEDVIGKHLRELYGEEVYRQVENHFARALQGHPVTYQRTHTTANGESRHLEVKVLPHIGDQGQVLGCFAVTTDVTEYKLAEQALRDSAQKLRLFADNVPAMTVSYDENLRCRFANKAFAEFFDFTVESILGKHLRQVVGNEAYREIEGYFARVLQGHPVTYQRTHKLANGDPCYLEVKLLPHIGDQGQALGCFAVTTDITEHKLAEERIQRMAHHDSLTGLPNRMLFKDRLDQTIRLAKRDSRQFALLYLDLDRFKPVNDTLGHAAGDELLQAVAARIRREVRESDTVARVGGDEFIVILPDIERREEAETVAAKIIAAFDAPFRLSSQAQSIGIGTSIGITLYPADALDADALIKAADAAMYSAKQTGNSIRFYGA